MVRSPYLAAMMGNVGKKSDKFFLIKILCRNVRLECFSYLCGKCGITEPLNDGHGEALLLSVCPFIGKGLVCRASENCLRIVCDLIGRGVRCSLLHNEAVKIRNAKLK